MAKQRSSNVDMFLSNKDFKINYKPKRSKSSDFNEDRSKIH